MQFVDAAHHSQIVRLGDGLVAVDPRARHAHKRALAAHRQVLARPFDHRSSTGRALALASGPEIPFARQLGDWPREIGLGLNCRIAGAGWQQRVGGAAGRAVDEGQRPAAVHDPQRVQEVRSRVALEHGKAVADLGQPERQRLSIGGAGSWPSRIAWRNSLPVISRASA